VTDERADQEGTATWPDAAEAGQDGLMAGEAQPATAAGRSRRPTSLREQYLPDSDTVPRRRLSAPSFPSAPPVPGSPVTPPVSETAQAGNSGQVPPTSNAPGAASRLGKLPTDKSPLDKLPLDKLPLGKLPLDKLPTAGLSGQRLKTLTRQRPEVGVGLAFAGGLVIATILKRLGRR
jgi:hypothetical protein